MGRSFMSHDKAGAASRVSGWLLCAAHPSDKHMRNELILNIGHAIIKP